MITEQQNLREDGSAYFTSYIQEPSGEIPYSSSRPAVVICPGGAYGCCSDREAEPVALAFMTRGFNAFVVRYSVGENASYPNPLADLSKTLKLLRDDPEKWHIKKDQISVCGFSAGGHLTASLATMWSNPEIRELSGCLRGENRPDAVLLIYPVITMGAFTHAGTRNNLLQGHDASRAEMVQKLSCELHVDANTPPAFLAHTYADNAVPAENSLLFASAMAAADRPFELHLFQEGYHGLSLANQNTFSDPSMLNRDFSQWIDLACKWLINRFGMEGVPDMAPHAQCHDDRAKAVSPV